MRFVLDCSVAISWCLPDESNAYADAVLILLSIASIASSIDFP